jgi:hypothetical protein
MHCICELVSMSPQRTEQDIALHIRYNDQCFENAGG